jgi:hypothetical protein
MTRTKKRGKGILKKKSLGVIVFAVILFSIVLIYSLLHSPTNQTTDQTFQFKAAIVDQGSLSPAAGPNPVFVQTTTNILEQAGFTVDYYPYENVTVEFYRNLPTYSYGLIILRVHSTATGVQGTKAPVVLFTSEPYSGAKYVHEQLVEQLYEVSFSKEENEEGIGYFGITPLFVSGAMKGKFQNTIIIMMGCEGLDNTLMAEAFVEKGAKVYISWNQGVLASHTDSATMQLLHYFLVEKLTLKKSVQETFKEVGFDPIYKSLLVYYPVEVGAQTIENITGTR